MNAHLNVDVGVRQDDPFEDVWDVVNDGVAERDPEDEAVGHVVEHEKEAALEAGVVRPPVVGVRGGDDDGQDGQRHRLQHRSPHRLVGRAVT